MCAPSSPPVSFDLCRVISRSSISLTACSSSTESVVLMMQRNISLENDVSLHWGQHGVEGQQVNVGSRVNMECQVDGSTWHQGSIREYGVNIALWGKQVNMGSWGQRGVVGQQVKATRDTELNFYPVVDFDSYAVDR